VAPSARRPASRQRQASTNRVSRRRQQALAFGPELELCATVDVEDSRFFIRRGVESRHVLGPHLPGSCAGRGRVPVTEQTTGDRTAAETWQPTGPG